METAIENKIQGECGLQYWEEKGRTEQLMKSVCVQSTYLRTKKNIQETLGFGKDHDVLPVFKSSGIYGAKLQRFRCVENKANNEKYYQAKALVCTEACVEKNIFLSPLARNIS